MPPVLKQILGRQREARELVAAVAGAERVINAITGICNMLLDTRYSRVRCRIPAGTAWTFINGVEPADLKATGKR